MEELLAEIPKCGVLCDVGCDHGFLGCAALERSLCERVLFSDISAASLAKAERLCAALGLQSRSEFVCGEGLLHVEHADVAAVAGMGGREIAAIVCARPDAADLFVLQPMKNGPELRTALVGNGFRIRSDRKIEDAGRFYDLIVAVRGRDVLTRAERIYGRSNLRNPQPAFLRSVAARREIVEAALQRNLAPAVRQRLERERQELSAWEVRTS